MPSSDAIWRAIGLAISLSGAALGVKLASGGVYDLFSHNQTILLGGLLVVVVFELGKVVAARLVLGRGRTLGGRFAGVLLYGLSLGVTLTFVGSHVDMSQKEARADSVGAKQAYDKAIADRDHLLSQLREARTAADRPVRGLDEIERERKSIANTRKCWSKGNANLPVCKQHAELTKELDDARDVLTAKATVSRLEKELEQAVTPTPPEGAALVDTTKLKLVGLLEVDAAWAFAVLVELLIILGAMAENTGFYHGGMPPPPSNNDGGTPPPSATSGDIPPPTVVDGGIRPGTSEWAGPAPRRSVAEAWLLTQLQAHGKLVPPQTAWAAGAGVTEQTMGRAVRALQKTGRVRWVQLVHGGRELRLCEAKPVLAVVGGGRG